MLSLRTAFRNWGLVFELEPFVEAEVIRRLPDVDPMGPEFAAARDIVKAEVEKKLSAWVIGISQVEVLFDLDAGTATIVKKEVS